MVAIVDIIRVRELIEFIEAKYRVMLDELNAREAKILSKKGLKPEDVIELIGIRASKEIILNELNSDYQDFLNHYEAKLCAKTHV